MLSLTSERGAGHFLSGRPACAAFQAEKGAQISTEVRRRRGLVIFRPAAVVAATNAYAGRAYAVSGDISNTASVVRSGFEENEGRFREMGVVSDDFDIRDAGDRNANMIHADTGDRVARGVSAKRKRDSVAAHRIRVTFAHQRDGGKMALDSFEKGESVSWRCRPMKKKGTGIMKSHFANAIGVLCVAVGIPLLTLVAGHAFAGDPEAGEHNGDSIPVYHCDPSAFDRARPSRNIVHPFALNACTNSQHARKLDRRSQFLSAGFCGACNVLSNANPSYDTVYGHVIGMTAGIFIFNGVTYFQADNTRAAGGQSVARSNASFCSYYLGGNYDNATSTCSCPTGQTPNATHGRCECPSATPLLENGACVASCSGTNIPIGGRCEMPRTCPAVAPVNAMNMCACTDTSLDFFDQGTEDVADDVCAASREADCPSNSNWNEDTNICGCIDSSHQLYERGGNLICEAMATCHAEQNYNMNTNECSCPEGEESVNSMCEPACDPDERRNMTSGMCEISLSCNAGQTDVDFHANPGACTSNSIRLVVPSDNACGDCILESACGGSGRIEYAVGANGYCGLQEQCEEAGGNRDGFNCARDACVTGFTLFNQGTPADENDDTCEVPIDPAMDCGADGMNYVRDDTNSCECPGGFTLFPQALPMDESDDTCEVAQSQTDCDPNGILNSSTNACDPRMKSNCPDDSEFIAATGGAEGGTCMQCTGGQESQDGDPCECPGGMFDRNGTCEPEVDPNNDCTATQRVDRTMNECVACDHNQVRSTADVTMCDCPQNMVLRNDGMCVEAVDPATCARDAEVINNQCACSNSSHRVFEGAPDVDDDHFCALEISSCRADQEVDSFNMCACPENEREFNKSGTLVCEVPVTCIPPQVMSTENECVSGCPSGQELDSSTNSCVCENRDQQVFNGVCEDVLDQEDDCDPYRIYNSMTNRCDPRAMRDCMENYEFEGAPDGEEGGTCTQCTGGRESENGASCECPTAMPLDRNGTCVASCEADEIVDSGRCVSCGDNQIRGDGGMCQCMDRHDNIGTESELNCVPECRPNQDRDDDDRCFCPNDSHFEQDNGDCVDRIAPDSCPDGQTVNRSTNTCETCGANQMLIGGMCQCIDRHDNIGTESELNCVPECRPNQRRRDSDNQCFCPDLHFEQPNGDCVDRIDPSSCEAPEQVNRGTNQCECPSATHTEVDGVCEENLTSDACPDNASVDSTTNRCRCDNSSQRVFTGALPDDATDDFCAVPEECSPTFALNEGTNVCECPGGQSEEGGRCVERCRQDQERNSATGGCECPQGQVDDSAASRCRPPATGQECINLGLGAVIDRSACVARCPEERPSAGDDGVCGAVCGSGSREVRSICQACPANSEHDSISPTAGESCACTQDGDVVHANVAGESAAGACAPPLLPSTYSAQECEDSGWPADLSGAGGRALAELCHIPVEIGGDQQPAAQQLDVSDSIDFCVLRQNSEYDLDAADAHLCSDERLFGNFGLPQRPQGLEVSVVLATTTTGDLSRMIVVSGGRLTVTPVVGQDGSVVAPAVISFGGSFVSRIAEQAAGSYNRFADHGLLALGPIVGLAVYSYFSDEAIYLPDWGYRGDIGDGTWTYGGRVEYSGPNWQSYVSASGESNASALVYESGGAYDGGAWAASYATRESGGEGDYSFALSTEWRAGMWQVKPHWRMNFAYDELFDWESSAGFSMDALWQSYKWTVRPRAALSWHAGASSAPRVNVDVRREF